jgi:hypothetical protein
MAWSQTTWGAVLPLPAAPNRSQVAMAYFDKNWTIWTILAIGDGTSKSPAQVFRILGDYSEHDPEPSAQGFAGQWPDLMDASKSMGNYTSLFDYTSIKANGGNIGSVWQGTIAQLLTTQGFLEPRIDPSNNPAWGSRGKLWLGYRHSSCYKWWDNPPGFPDPGPHCVWRSWHQPSTGDPDYFLIFVGQVKVWALQYSDSHAPGNFGQWVEEGQIVTTQAANEAAVATSGADTSALTKGTNFW